MISVIICSINPSLLKVVSDNINTTIGVQYEIIATDNRGSDKGICQVYNEASEKAQYDVLCFVHEDVIIKTDNWGTILIEMFKDSDLGLVGVAGSSYRPLTPCQWGGIGGRTAHKNIIQSFKDKNKSPSHHYFNPNDEGLAKVACVDGVWLATTKKVMDKIKFDEHNFPGFHVYDIDFSMSVSQKYKVAVTYDILVHHFSEGHYTRDWMNANLKFHEKWIDHLPVNLAGLNKKEIFFGEKAAFKRFIDQLIYFKVPIATAFRILNKKSRFFNTAPTLFFKLQFYVFKKYLQRVTPKVESILHSLLVVECLHIYQSFI